ncbi:MAG: class I SAM-dependent methyltransferase [Fibrobacteria bacterium]|nr:class I SAM-dependent methyltransferase [Fibrobacteria bacterium]
MISWDDYWKQYSISKAERWMISERDRKLQEWISSLGEGPKKVMEVGCGFGSNIRLLHRTRPDVECHALDFSEESCRKIAEEIPHVHRGDCQDTGLEAASFDFVYSSGLMEHFRDEGPFVREMFRLVKPGGLMATFVPAKWSIWQAYQLAYKITHPTGWIHGYEKAYSRAQLHRVISREGWMVEKEFGLDPFSFNGFFMKLLNVTYAPIWRRSPLSAGYTEICLLARRPV